MLWYRVDDSPEQLQHRCQATKAKTSSCKSVCRSSRRACPFLYDAQQGLALILLSRFKQGGKKGLTHLPPTAARMRRTWAHTIYTSGRSWAGPHPSVTQIQNRFTRCRNRHFDVHIYDLYNIERTFSLSSLSCHTFHSHPQMSDKATGRRKKHTRVRVVSDSPLHASDLHLAASRT